MRFIRRSAVTTVKLRSFACAQIHKSFSSIWSLFPVALSSQSSTQRGRSFVSALVKYLLARFAFNSAYAAAVCLVTSSTAYSCALVSVR